MTLEELTIKLNELRKEKEEAIKNQQYEMAACIRDKERRVREEIEKIEEKK